MKSAEIDGYVLGGDEKSQKLIVQVNMPFLDLKEHHRFTQIDEPEADIDDITADRSNQFYQRRVDPKRIKEIADFIRKSIIHEYKGLSVATLFPSAMLLATSIEDTSYKPGERIYLKFNGSNEDIYIIDGQHRLSGMLYLYDNLGKNPTLFQDEEDEFIKNYLENYRFNCTLFLNFDLWEQAQVFADVNFNQKKVSKNLYYTIYGMQYPETNDDLKKNYIYIAHRLVLLLNSHKGSPLYSEIKMIGFDKGLISQSFLADSLIRSIRYPSGIWHFVLTQPKPRMRPIAVELMTFFKAVRDVFVKEWINEGKHTTILTKTTGIGAMIRTMEYIHRFILLDDIKKQLEKVTEGYFCPEYYEEVKKLLEKVRSKESDLFSLKGEFSGTGGQGLEIRLFERIKSLITSPCL